MAAEKIICDTDVMIDYWDQAQSRHAVTKTILEKHIGLDNIVLSAVTKMELMAGAINKTDLSKINKNLERFNIALINDEITIKAFDLMTLHLPSHGISIPDSIIAATSIITNLKFFTYNTKDFRFISGLSLYKP